jgi:hypothetical protein
MGVSSPVLDPAGLELSGLEIAPEKFRTYSFYDE